MQALDGLGFEVAEGTIFGLLGPNGAGKSTTVKILTTPRPDAGEARVADHDVLTEPAQVRRSIGVAAQRSGVDRDLTGRENVRLQGQLQGLRGRELDRRADELLDQFGLADAAGRVARTYSGGMQRRLDIAIALVHRPRVLFLDEPTTASIRRSARRCGGDRPAAGRRGPDDPAHDALHGRGRPARVEDRDRRSRPPSPRLADGAQGRPAWGRRARRARRAEANGNVHSALENVPGLRDVLVEGRSLHARVDDGARAVPAVLAALDAHSVPVATVTVARPHWTTSTSATPVGRSRRRRRRTTNDSHRRHLGIDSPRSPRLWRQPWFIGIV